MDNVNKRHFNNLIIKLLSKKLTFMLTLLVVLLSFTNVHAANSVYNFGYTGSYQTFTAPYDGIYKIELWGAQGGQARADNKAELAGGYGAYTAGMIDLKKGQKFYIYVGQQGNIGVKSGYAAATWNGGGRGDYDHADDDSAGSGGGATDVRLVAGSWNDFASLKSRIMVAGGGGGTAPWTGTPGHGGSLSSNNSNVSAGATQTAGYSFGTGQNGVFNTKNTPVAGGGGGYYGGRATNAGSTYTNGSGGSSFISGFDGCNAIAETSVSSGIIHTGQSIHYSGLKFDYGVMMRGNGYTDLNGSFDTMTQMPNPSGGFYAAGTGRTGAGYARITYFEDVSSSDYPNHSIKEGKTYRYAYTGNYQTFVAPANATYKFEAWGARGGYGLRNSSASNRPGYGAYATGNIHLNKGDTYYVYVGQAGYNGRANCKYCGGYGGYNGGGKGGNDSNHDSDPDEGGGGGGATDFRLVSGTWNEINSLKSRVLIAGGGAGSTYGLVGEHAALRLNNATYQYQLGVGQAGYSATSGSGGGGGGYFGGVSTQCDGCQGYGGTSYVSGSSDDKAISSTTSSTSSYSFLNDSIHYSGIKFDNPTKINGASSMPNTAGTGTMTGNNGNGYAKITILSLDVGYPNLKTLTIDNATIQPDFDPETFEYNVYVDSENYHITIDGTPLHDDDLIFRGLDTIDLKSGVNKHVIGLINDLGNVSIYSLKINRPASPYGYLQGIKVDGVEIEDFDPETLEYTLNIPDTTEEVNLEAILGRPSQTISGDGKIEIGFGTTTHEVNVLSEDGNVLTTYTINFQKSNSSKLKSLKIEDYKLTPDFDPETLEYTVEISTGSLYVDVDAVAFDKTATVSIEGNGYLPVNKKNKIYIRVNQASAGETVYIVNVEREGSVENEEYSFACSKKFQTFEAPATTYYKIQAWGARGGYGRTHWTLKFRGGFGAYTEGEIHLKKGDKLYIYVGCEGAQSAAAGRCTGGAGGWNGGGTGGNDSNCDSASEPGGGGGGASDIRLVKTSDAAIWNDFNSLKSRIMVAAGGGGGTFGGSGGAGGTLKGIMGYGSKSVATQTAGYAFALGQTGGPGTSGSGGAGGGYFGGYSSTAGGYGGGGGSSFVSGCEGCLAVSETATASNITSSGSNTHYSGYVFDTITMLSGDESMPSPNGGYMTGNNGNGRVIITGGRDRSSNNFLRNITVDKGELSPAFDLQTLDYTVLLDAEDDEIKINAKLEDDTASVTGIGTFDVESGTTTFPITVTAENGDIRIYNVVVTRGKSSNSKPIDIVISGLVPSLCALNDSYCKVEPTFNPNTSSYDITVPARIKQVEFTVIKGHKYQTTSGDGIVSLVGGDNLVTIEVTSEDGNSTSSYTYNIVRDMTGNTTIESLIVKRPDININFNPDLTEYYFSVPNEATDLELEIVLEDENASYEIIGNNDFTIGLNIVTIRVTAVNGETKDYTLNVYREKNGNVFLSNLEVLDTSENSLELTPVFNKITTTYVVNVPNEIDKVNIVAEAEHVLSTVSGDGEVDLNVGVNNFNVAVTAENGETEIYKVSIIRAKNSDATLKSLDIAEGTITPEFDPLTNNYSVDVAPGITSLNINAVPNKDTSKVQIIDNSGFKIGENIVKIQVTAEDGTKNVYKVVANRIASSNNYLHLLTTDKYDMTEMFDKDTLEYNIEVENDISVINVIAEKEDRLSKVSGTGIYNLKTGDNEINVTVTSEDGNDRVYTLHVFRKLNSNANLMSITADCDIVLDPEFNADTVNYRIELDNSITSISLIGVPEVKTSKVIGNGTYDLEVGENTVVLLVRAEDNTERQYKLTIRRNKSTNANLSSLSARESVLDPSFNSGVLSYNLRVLEEVTSLTLKVVPESSAATVEIIGNENFEIGNNVVIVRVTAEDGTTQKEYTLNVLRQEKGTTSTELKTLSMVEKAFTPAFSPTTIYYEVEVPYTISTATLQGELDDKNATVTGLGQHNLIVGENIIPVMVTSTEGIVRTYQVVVTRRENDEARLANLMISGSSLSPVFNRDVYEYSLSTQDAFMDIVTSTVDPDATYTIIGNANLTLGDNTVIIRVLAKDKETTKDYTLHVNKLASNNNNLASLDAEGVTLTPEFAKTTTVYYATVSRDVNNIQITAIPEDINATVTGDGDTSLEVGTNYKEIEVTSESGIKKVYTLIITRTPNSNNYLESLEVNRGELTPSFEKDVNDYTVVVPYEVDKISLTGSLDDDTATVVGFDTYDLVVGENNLKVVVTSEGNQTNTYKIKVVREDIVSSLLKTLDVRNYYLTPNFNSEVFDYDVVVDNEVTSLNLNYSTIDKNATVEVRGNSDFVVGLNTVEIEVTDSKGLTTTTYTINVNRQNYSNTYLSYISTSRGELVPMFTKTNLTYEVNVSNTTTSITIEAEPEVESCTVTGVGTFDLEPGENKFPIKVTSTTGITRTYYVNVTRALKDDNFLESLQVRVNNELQKITPDFDKETLTYSLEVPAGTTNIVFNGTASVGATVTGLGSNTVKLGENKFPIVVTSESGNARVYNVNVTRPASSDNYLTSLVPSVGTLDPAFSYFGTDYTLRLDSSASLLSFEVTTSDRFATVSGTSKEIVPDGESERQIVVTAEDGTERVYTISIEKDRTDEARLESLSVKGYTFTESFNSDKFNYVINVPNSKKILLASEVTAVPIDKNATVNKTNSITLNAAVPNLYTIVVTAKDGFTKQTYYITVNREKGNEAKLASLKFNVGTLSPVFNSDLFDYVLTVPNSVTEITYSNVAATTTVDDAYITKMDRLVIEDERDDPTKDIYTIKVTSGDETAENTYKVKVIYLQSNDATLKELSLDNGTLTPAFDRNTFEYDVDVLDTLDKINVVAIPNHSKGVVISGDGENSLDKYDNEINVTVQAENGSIKIYKINVHKSITMETQLNGLRLTKDCDDDKCPLSPSFDSDIYEYKTTVENEIANIGIDYTKRHQNQLVRIYDSVDNELDKDNISLRVGDNKIRLEVINTIGGKSDYNLVITRKKSANNYLSELSISNPQTEDTVIDFNKEQLEYYITIANNIDDVAVNAVKEDAKAVVRISGAKNLEVGNNDIIVSVQAENGDMREYVIHALKEGDSNNYLQSLTVSSGTIYKLSPKFNKGIYDYVTTVPSNVEKVNIDAVPELDTTIVGGTGEKTLKTGVNTFEITSTSNEGTISTYKVIVNKLRANKLYLKSLSVSEGTLSPEFEKETMSYTIGIPSSVDKLTINAVPEDDDATVKIVGNNNLIAGENNVYIVLSNKDKTVTTTYILNVNKALDTNNYLKSIKVGDSELMTPEKREVTDFTFEVEYNVSEINLSALPEVDLTRVSGEGLYSLAYGNNELKLYATSEAGDIREYTVNVVRKYNNDLLMISVDRGELSPSFDKDVVDYYVEVEKEVYEINVLAVALSEVTNIEGNGYHDLQIGENLIEVIVSSPNGTSKTYKLHVTRNKSSNTNLTGLYVEEGVLDPVFDKDTLSYSVEVPYNVTQVTIDYECEDMDAKVTIKGNENLKLGENLVEVEVEAEDGTKKTYEINVIVQDEAEYSNKLKSLSVDKGILSPNFDPDIVGYTVTVTNDIDAITISGTLESVKARVTGLGRKNLELGRNVFPIVVTSKDGKTRTYSVIVYRIKSSDARLKNISFDKGTLTPLFDKDVTEYSMTIDSSISDITETVEPLVNGTTYTISGNRGLKLGENIVEVVATASDGVTKRSYRIKVTKEVSNDNFLDSLTSNIGTLSPKFTKDNTGPYVINVDDNVNSIVLDGKLSSSTATVTGLGLHKLKKGANTISVVVTSEAGDSRTYTVIVNKALSSDTALSFLKTSDGELNPEFDPEIVDYSIEVDEEVSEMTVLGLARDSAAKVAGNGKYIISAGENNITLTVTAENGDTKNYTITVTKKKEASSKLSKLSAREGKITPEFSPNQLEYSIQVPNEVRSLTLDVELEDPEASYQILGNEEFVVGSNQVMIKVTSTKGVETIYVINVIRQTASNNYLKSLEGVNLTPAFDRAIQYYEVELDKDVEEINLKGEAEDANATIDGLGVRRIEKGENYVYITVTSVSGVDRVYTLKIKRNKSNDNTLSRLSVNIGELTPEFNSLTTEYNVDVPAGVDEIEISAIANDVNATVTGSGVVSVETGENRYEIVVTAEDGSTNIYTIIATKLSSDNTNIENIIPSSGVLSPSYAESIDTYEVEVDEDVSVISFEVLLEDRLSTVEGNLNNPLDYGDNLIEIVVTAEDGTKKSVFINVIREKNITEIEALDVIVMAAGEDTDINPIIKPDDATNKEVVYTSSDPTIAEVDDTGKVTANKIGEAEITIASKKNSNVKKIVKIVVLNLVLESDDYDVRHDEINIVIGALEKETLREFQMKMKNNDSLLRFYDLEANEITDLDNTYVATGQIITLEFNGKVYDQAWIVLRGDNTEEGDIDVSDMNNLKLNLSGKLSFDGYLFPSSDVAEDKDIDVSDMNKLKLYLSGKLKNLNLMDDE